MPHTYTNCLIHCVFSTKERMPQITKDIKDRLWQFIGGIARANGFRAIEVGGHNDHSHSLIALPSTITISKAVQLIKGGSSKFVHETFRKPFEWQEGYGAFSVSASGRDTTIAYIRSQEEHHRVRSFKEEYIAFLEENGVEYDPRYVFD